MILITGGAEGSRGFGVQAVLVLSVSEGCEVNAAAHCRPVVFVELNAPLLSRCRGLNCQLKRQSYVEEI
jgi:hypothetical protein